MVPVCLLAVVWAVLNFPFDKMGSGLVMLTLVTVFFSAYFRIEIPRAKLHLTISDGLVFLSLLFFGGGVAVLLAMLEAGFSTLKLNPAGGARRRVAFKTILVNVLTAGISTFGTALLVAALFGSPGVVLESGNNTQLAFLLAVMTLSQFAINTILASAYISLKTGAPLLKVWNQHCFNALALFCSGAVMAGLGAKAVRHVDMVQFALAAGFFGLVYFTYKRYTDDVRKSATQAEQSEVARAREAEVHISELNHFVDELKKTADELSESRESFRHAAYHDKLTDLPNRTYIIELIDQLLKDSGPETNAKFAVLLLNLNRFRSINDSLGYQTGDRVIKHLAKRLSEMVVSGEIIGHFGGDTFAVILTGISDCGTATAFADSLAQRVAEAVIFKGRQVYTTASIGVVVRDATHQRAESMLRDADIAMYYAKDRRMDWAVFDRSMRANAEARQKMETDLRYAIVCNELEMYYQPIVDLNTMRVYGFESLVRWNHPESGLIAPSEFIPLSEDTGLVIPMTLQILRGSCLQAVAWQRKYPDLRYLIMSVNLSGKHFSDSSLVEQIDTILKETGIEPQCLKLEITESSTMEDAEKAIEKLREIRRLGVKLSIDDFGTGYSSLSYLRRFPLDTLKIDRSFVSAMEESSESDEIVNTIMALANSLKLDVVAEGIENVEQLKHLRRLGCEYGQGYLFSRPLTVNGVEAMIAERPDWSDLVKDSVFNSDTADNDYSQAEFTN